jgi:translation elongation factor EF-Ts
MSAQMSNNRSSKNTQEMGVGMKMKANMSVQKIKADVCMHVAVSEGLLSSYKQVKEADVVIRSTAR